ncbi:M4 family metallopeptidase [Flavobacterium wongokense]|uniref:M4 family metallopeptidase n=1 Tax=Flavobacterium wongokense TaxID=2910674 RepID=UPI001F3D367D|nr:M4 family metallopeptidase [Flavobacterium sp. WG47]MCF6130843.1 M4 family metallopeptidase [Flavobacterium sp. WG47]
MKKNNIVLLASLFLAFCVNAQNRIKENAPFQKVVRFDEAISKENAIKYFLKQQGLDSDNSFVAARSTSDETGMVHQRHQQFYKGLKVEFGTLITHSKNGKVTLINAEVYKAPSSNLVPSLTQEQGLNKAINNVNATKYLWDDPKQAEVVGYQKPQGELLLFPIVNTGEVKLAYKYDIYAIEPVSRQEIYIDANNGQVLYKNPVIKHLTNSTVKTNDKQQVENFEALVTGNAFTKYSGQRSIQTRFDTPLNMFVLDDQTRGNGIITYNCERIVATYQNVHFKDNDNNWTAAEHANTFWDNAALDAHWGAEMTFDFWKTVFNRNSYDDNNGDIRSYVHYKQTNANFDNAFWNGSFMTYGDGTAGKPYTTIDICGHEIGHAVNTYTAALAYRNQSGAMNEGFSDIWGACIEHFGRTGAITGTPVANVWKIGEDSTNGGLRSMSNPLSLGDPDTFQGTNYVVTGDDGFCTPNANTNDYCGVHTNSGVLNKWFYLLTAGGSGTNNAPIADRDTYNVVGVGMQKSSQIAYYLERDYLTPNSTFFDARVMSIELVKTLYCTSAPEVAAVTNAWFAVNVGTSFVNAANDVSQESLVGNNSANCGTPNVIQTVTFRNLGSNALTSVTITYNIDGGSNSTATWTGNLSTCSVGTQQLTINTGSLTPGVHTLNVTTTTTGDGVVSNNARSSYIYVNQSGVIGQVNTFESAADNLLASDEPFAATSLWQRGIINKPNLTSAVADNSNVYATGLTNPYTSDTKAYLTSRCYDLSQTANPLLKFHMAFDLQYSGDILYMQYSTNGGSTWSRLGSMSDPNWYTADTGCPTCVGGEWTGDAGSINGSGFPNGAKRLYSYNLAAFGSASPSPQTNMLFRFVFQSDATDNYDGAFIDNFVIEAAPLSNEEFTANTVSIYPNPANNALNFSVRNGVNVSAVTINDVSGKQIYKLANLSNNSIDVSSLASGVYFITFKTDNSSVTKKFIKE